jgi:hypothetical protein
MCLTNTLRPHNQVHDLPDSSSQCTES